jgi:hypothetical protein
MHCRRQAGAIGRLTTTPLEFEMKALVDLFSTDYGLFSIGVILFTLFMGIWFYRFFMRKMNESEKNDR